MGTTRRARKSSGAGRRIAPAEPGNARTGRGQMKRKGFPHVAKQTHDVFDLTDSSSKRILKLAPKKVFEDET